VGRVGCRVLPAKEEIASRSGNAEIFAANWAASPVPPRMSTRI
jgi:hypothetical protein